MTLFQRFLKLLRGEGVPSKHRWASATTADASASQDPITDYERGLGGTYQPLNYADPYDLSQRSLFTLVKLYRRQTRREAVAKEILARIPDALTKEWVAEQLHTYEFSRLAIGIRPGRSDADTVAVWRSLAEADENGDDAPPEESDVPGPALTPRGY